MKIKKPKCPPSKNLCAATMLLAVSAMPRLAFAVIGPGAVAGPVNIAASDVLVGSTTVTNAGATADLNVTGGTLTIDSTAGPAPGPISIQQTGSGVALQANGGAIVVQNDNITVQSKTGHAVSANGVASSVTVTGTGATISTSSSGTSLVAINGGNVDVTNTTLSNTSTGTLGHGVIAQTGGIVTLRSGNSFSTVPSATVTQAIALGAAGAGSQVKVLSPMPITMNGKGEIGVYVFNGGQVFLPSNSTITLNAQQSAGVLVDNTIVAPGTIGSGLTLNFNGAPNVTAGAGVVAFNGGNITLDALTVQGTGGGTGAWAQQNSSITLTNSKIDINSATNAAFFKLNTPTIVNATNTTSAFTVIGVAPNTGLNSNGGVISVDNTTINVTSAQGIGATTNLNAAGPLSNITLNNSVVTTTGVNSVGLQVGNNSLITATNSKVTTSGGSSALNMFTTTNSGFAQLNLINTDVLTADATTTGLISNIFSNPTTPTAPNQFNMSGGSMVTVGDAAIIAQSLLDASFTDGAIVTGGAGILFLAGAAAAAPTPATLVNLDASGGSILTGDAGIVSAPSTVNFTITDQAIWTGAAAFQGITNATIGATGTWNVTANSLVTNQVSNTGRIAMVPAGNNFKTLTTTDYIGNGGILSLNTFLDTDGSPSDLLIIDGGTATGNTSLIVNNTTGLGALTVQNGILVVDAINGATTDPNAFTLGAPVLAGPYEYSLFYGSVDAAGPENWYLRSVRTEDPTEPDFRQEVSLYAALSSVGFLYGRMMLDTLHERVGEEEQLRNRPDLWRGNGGWIRFVYRDGNINDDDIFNKGPDFKYHFKALQAGSDLYRHEHLDGSRDHAGLYIASGSAKAKVEHTHGTEAGNATVDIFTFGGYWTHFGSTGWYLDGVLHGNWFDYVANSGRVTPLTPDGNGFAVSLEGGYPLKFGDRFVIEPQAQAFYQRQTICDASDNAATIRFGWTDGTTSRVGLRIAHDWVLSGAQHSTEPQRLFTGWLRANQWYQHGGGSNTEFSSDIGFTPFPSELSAQWVQLELGITGQVTANTSLYATYSRDYYQHDRGRGSEAIAGLRVNL